MVGGAEVVVAVVAVVEVVEVVEVEVSAVVVASVVEVGVSVVEETGVLVSDGVLVTSGEVVVGDVVDVVVVVVVVVAGVVSSGCAPAASSVVAGAGAGSSTGGSGCLATGRDAAVARADGATVPESALPETVGVDGAGGSTVVVPGWVEAVAPCAVRPAATVVVEADIAELAPMSCAAGDGGSVTSGTSAATRTARKSAPASTSAAPTIHAPTRGRRRLGGETVDSGAACRDRGRPRPGSSPGACCSAPACLPTGPPPVLRCVVRGNDGSSRRIRL